MAKKAILDVLESTIGKYVRNLDAENLNVAVWSGKIQLQSLELNTDAVNAELDRRAAEAPNLAIPFRVVGGSFENFQVDVPWARITSRPVVLRASGLKVFIEPHERNFSNLAAGISDHKRVAKLLKERASSIDVYNDYRLQANALAKLAEVEDDDEEGDGTQDTGDKTTFTARLVRRIIENLQVEIDDVHVALKGSGCDAGCILSSISLVTTDKNGARTFVDRTMTDKGVEESFLYKALSIRGFGIYLDEVNPLVPTKMKNASEVGHTFVLSPLSFEAKLRQSDSADCTLVPKYLLSSELKQLSIVLSRTQVELAVQIQRTIKAADNTARPLFPQYRPLSRVSKATAKQWWKYAFRSVSRLNGTRSWVEFWHAFKKRRQYIPLYKRDTHHENCPWLTPLSEEEKRQLQTLEQDRAISFEGLMSWRNIADAQAEREQRKHEDANRNKKRSSSYYSYLFGSKDGKATGEDDPPITLSTEEMKELEETCLVRSADEHLSSESKLCDIKFKLGSFNVNLTTSSMQPIVALDMGAVHSSLDANADGSFVFDFNMSSLSVWDLVTAESLYPTVFRNLQSQSERSAFELHLEKAKTGDQKVFLTLVAFELVGSPLLAVEMKKFLTVDETPIAASATNPMLRKSLSGSVDLFYDASGGDTPSKRNLQIKTGSQEPTEAELNVSDKLSSAVAEAWKNKTKERTKWTIDCDVHAPVLVLPENCLKLDANVMIFDLGHFRFEYGKSESSKDVREWFDSQPRKYAGETSVEPGVLSVDNLTFTIATTKDVAYKRKSDDAGREQWRALAVIEPLSATLDFGIESHYGTYNPRASAFGVFPSVCLRVSPKQATRALSVTKAWKRVLKQIVKGTTEQEAGLPIIAEAEVDDDATTVQPAKAVSKRVSETLPRSTDRGISDKEPTWLAIYASLALQRFSFFCTADDGDGVEAHLVSVSTTFGQYSDGSSQSRVRMGWFWVLDRLKSDLPRQQRFLAHSRLPRPSSDYAATDYNVFASLDEIGVFDNDAKASSNLADVTWTTASDAHVVIPDDALYELSDPAKEREASSMAMDAKFSSLLIFWNPHAIIGMTTTFTSMFSSFRDLELDHANQPLTPRARRLSVRPEAKADSKGSLFVRATMENLEICLNSARDDLALFTFSMTGTEVSMLSSPNNMRVSASMADLRVSTPEPSPTLDSYRTMLGLAAGRSESLLTVHYVAGESSLKPILSEIDTTKKCEAFADIQISPMRFVYIHAQVMTLVEYATEGILGAIAARAAASAANAALEIAAAAETGEKVFQVKAVGIDVVLPQAAAKNKYLQVYAGELGVVYHALPAPGGGKADLKLADVILRDSQEDNMVERPLQMTIAVDLPPEDIGSLDEQAMRVGINISKAAFLVTKSQYAQMMMSLTENLGQADPCLREHNRSAAIQTEDPSRLERGAEVNEPVLPSITHGGVAIVERQRRMFIDLNVEVLSFDLCSTSLSDPICHVAAVESTIKLNFFSDRGQMETTVTLHDLVCEDRRAKSVKRQFRALIEQTKGTVAHDVTSVQDVFFMRYLKDSLQNKSDYELRIGSPQMVFIPDAITDILDFLSTESRAPKEAKTVPRRAVTDAPIEVSVDDGGAGSIEATMMPPVYTMTLKATTGNCRTVMVDLGTSDLGATDQPESDLSTESVVMQGQIETDLTFVTQAKTGLTVKTDFSIHGNHFEVYSAHSRKLLSPLQILEPTDFAMFYSMQNHSGRPQEVEVRAVTMTPCHVTFSMQNMALFKTISSSLSSTIASTQEKEQEGQAPVGLSETESARIEALASALEKSSGGAEADDTQLTRGDSVVPVSESFSVSGVELGPASVWKLRLTMPESKMTIVNDLQGLDEALFRVTMSNFVTGAEATRAQHSSEMQTTFDGHMNTALSADYFDSRVNLWKRLLKKPWELTLKTSRGISRRFKTNRLSTTFDIESFPCHISFSEQFLVSINAANRMWGIYSTATNMAHSELDSNEGLSLTRKALAASAARNLVVSLPYAIDNFSGVDIYFDFSTKPSDDSMRLCQNGTIEYFRFERSKGNGYGGSRLYGQEVKELKSVTLFVGGTTIRIDHLDDELDKPRRAYDIGNGSVIMTRVSKKAKSTVLHVGSHVEMTNKTSIPFQVSVLMGATPQMVGVCKSKNAGSEAPPRRIASSTAASRVWKPSSCFSLPVEMIGLAEKMHLQGITIGLAPMLPGGSVQPPEIVGTLVVPSIKSLILELASGSEERVVDVTCKSIREGKEGEIRPDPLVVQVRMRSWLLGPQTPCMEILLEPRAKLENKLPVSLSVKTPMPHTFAPRSHAKTEITTRFTQHYLRPDDIIEVFTPGPSIAISVSCADLPVGGTTMTWMHGWVDLPMISEFRLVEPIRCVFPFSRKLPDASASYGLPGSEFLLVEATEDETRLDAASSEANLVLGKVSKDAMRLYQITVPNYGIDHTGGILFANVNQQAEEVPLSAFSAGHEARRVTLLPKSDSLIRLLHLTMDGVNGMRQSLPFRIEDISIADGGIESTGINWEDNTPSGFYAYRTLLDSAQSEVHIIPEFIVYNGSQSHRVAVRQVGSEVVVETGQMAQVMKHPKMGLVISLDYLDFGGRAGPLQVDDLMHRVAIVKSLDGFPIGSVAVQTVIGSTDSRLVVKLGEVRLGESIAAPSSPSRNLFERDLLRLRIRWSELVVTLYEAKPLSNQEKNVAFVEKALDEIMERSSSTEKPKVFKVRTKEKKTWLESRDQRSEEHHDEEHHSQQPVCTISLRRFTVDWQRIFKDSESPDNDTRGALLSPERSQLSIIIHNVQIVDDTPNTTHPVVFNSTSKISFFDLCVRLRGSLDADLVRVDLIDLNLCHANGVSEKMTLTTNEDFVWKMLDVANRILVATAELAFLDMKLEWNEETGAYEVIVVETEASGSVREAPATYTPPRTERLFDISRARVSPFTIVVTFKRQPQASRYKLLRGFNGAKLMNYFTTRLKFTLDKAELKFARYDTTNVKGPISRLLELIGAVYTSRMKLKIVTILSAASFQDWKFLASRDDGDDEFVEGDLLRVTGNLAGNTANYIVKKFGQGLGNGLSVVTHTIGDGIENATGKVGARAVGAGVNSVVSGLGDGVGDTLKGVGTGAGKVLKGAGKGVGHIVGGATGAVLLAGKGIGKGVSTGDGKAVVQGFSNAAVSVGTGVGQGVETAVMGAADGFMAVGQGLFSGVKNVGRGFGGAFTGGKKSTKRPTKRW